MEKNKSKYVQDFYADLEELIMANSGTDEFEEVYKLISLKIWAEKNKDVFPKSPQEANALLKKIQSSIPGTIEVNSFSLADADLIKALDIVNSFDVSGNLYSSIDSLLEFLVSKNKKGDKGQYFTPRNVINFCISIINPKANETVLDPAAGSGAFLVSSAIQGNADPSKLWSFDIDIKSTRISKLLFWALDLANINSFIVNSLYLPSMTQSNADFLPTIEDCMRVSHIDPCFDVIVTNPPFAGEITNIDFLSSYQLGEGKKLIDRDILFIERCISLLKPGGRMAIVLPNDIFGRKSNLYVRKFILSKCNVVGIISLPRSAFMPHTSTKTCILFLEKKYKNSQGQRQIFFGISDSIGKDSRGKDNIDKTQESDDLPDIEKEFKTFLEKEGYKWH